MDPIQSDCQYFLRRADEERAAAELASDPRARQSHVDLAERYADAAGAIAAATKLKMVEAEPESIKPAPILPPESRILP